MLQGESLPCPHSHPSPGRVAGRERPVRPTLSSTLLSLDRKTEKERMALDVLPAQVTIPLRLLFLGPFEISLHYLTLIFLRIFIDSLSSDLNFSLKIQFVIRKLL
ncbi:hypothetical protein E5288_WYG021086 [Bos mutus]|uniref:Uncharacterized protein n=1 Tax=Bos mutus TaxID=72004 RepID=A0A6B0S1X1_9CETA|nr:hypothetical protein [Bos mutus]